MLNPGMDDLTWGVMKVARRDCLNPVGLREGLFHCRSVALQSPVSFGGISCVHGAMSFPQDESRVHGAMSIPRDESQGFHVC